MNDYKDTLNLPKTGFPMKANLLQREPEILKNWESADIYTKLRLLRKNKETFVLHLGPPYANGDVHMGHVLTTVLKDIIVKSRTLSGYDAPLVPGWDCHGLPVELKVEKQIGKPGEKVTKAEFRTACRQYAKTQVEKQTTSFKRLGIIADWEKPYLTMNYQYEADIIRSLAKIIEKGYVKRGLKPVYWCIDCKSALAEAEVEYHDKESIAIDIRFKICDESALLSRFAGGETFEKTNPLSIPIWTTTPWTLPANQAVALNSHFQYILIECIIDQKPERLIIAEELLEETLKRYSVDAFKKLATCTGKALEGLLLQHPFHDRTVPIILADHVTADAGTGAVHTAPGHGQDDYVVGRRYNLPIDNPVDDKGCFLPNTPLFAGVHVHQANPRIVDLLRENDTLIFAETITHSYPHCWRHKSPVLFRATPQWFIDIDIGNLREKVLTEIKKVDWFPKWGETRITNMVKQRPDWCISRQRTWLVPIATFIHKETGEPHPNSPQLMEEVAKRVEQGGIEIWDTLDPTELLGESAKDYTKVYDTLDVWFDSGVSHACVLKRREDLRFPANVYLEGSDQYRGWFQSALITACAMFDESPYRQVVTNGFILDTEARKMSKSLGNVLTPEQVIKTFGADIMRLWVASTDYQSDVSVSLDIFQHNTDVYRRIRNTARFLLSNLHDFDPLAHALKSENMLALDRWIVDKTRLLQEEIQKHYEIFEFHPIVQKIHHFCTTDLGGFYLDIIKDRQYTSKREGVPRRSAQTAIYHVINALVRWITPVLTFTAEEILKYIPGNDEESILLTTWYPALAALSKDTIMNQAYVENVRHIRDIVNKEIENLRMQDILGSTLEAEVIIYADPFFKELLDQLADELRFVLITSSASVRDLHDASDNAIDTEIAGIKLKITASNHKKCVRCWHRRADVGQHPDHPDICARCVENIEGIGETRQFA